MPATRPLFRWWPWAVGVVAGLVVLGPALRPGALLNLDLLVLPRFRVPAGIWGLGPELPRRVPYGVVLAWVSNVVGGPATGKVFIVAVVAAAVAGAAWLARDAPVVARLGAGLLYGLSPFVLTRIGVGHLAVLLAVAILPWVLPTLLRPADNLPRTYLCAAGLGLAGVSGGTLALAAIVVGVVADRGRRVLGVAGAALIAQLPWIVPGIVVAAGGVRLTSAAPFATDADGVTGVLGLAAGHGFWRQSSQVGGQASVGVALLGAALVALACLGAGSLPRPWGRRSVALAAVGASLALASAVPGLRDLYGELTRTPLFGVGRESQRWLSLFLVWLAPAAALGAVRVGGRLTRGVPAACAVVLAVPGMWGVDGALEPVRIPDGWSLVAGHVRARPGPVLALPWHQYLDLRVAGGRRVLNPMPDFLGGDVLTSSDPELSLGRQEQTDPREPHADRVVDRILSGRSQASELAGLGVRWIVLLREVNWREYQALRGDTGLRRVVTARSIELYEVRAWRGPVITSTGGVLPARHVIAPVARVDPSGPARWHRPAEPGWMRGWRSTRESPVGTVDLPLGRGILWFWPTCAVVIAYLCTLWGGVRAGCALQGPEPSVPSDDKGIEQADGTT